MDAAGLVQKLCHGVLKVFAAGSGQVGLVVCGVHARVGGKHPTVRVPITKTELIDTINITKITEMREGPGFAHYDAIYSIDPWHQLVVKEVLTGLYLKYDLIIPAAKVVTTH